jgi:uncharacterized protein YijF (DUF1287 family)
MMDVTPWCFVYLVMKPVQGDRRKRTIAGLSLVAGLLCACAGAGQEQNGSDPFGIALSEAALKRTRHRIRYDGRYRVIDYPGGDVPSTVGVCTDVVIRAYRALGIDLQERVHRDMVAHFELYPRMWNLSRPDANIDHRRVPNLQVFFRRHGVVLPLSADPGEYKVGDLVTWTVGGNLPHIGIVVDRRSSDGHRPLIVHNIGSGPQAEDILFDFPMTGHYRYQGGE